MVISRAEHTFLERSLRERGLHYSMLSKSSTRELYYIDEGGNERMYRTVRPAGKFRFDLYAKVKSDAKAWLLGNDPYLLPYRKPADFFKWSISYIERCLHEQQARETLQIDVSAAYWSIARQIFLSLNTYLYGLELKKDRLRALGALATKTTYREYEGHDLLAAGEARPDTYVLYAYIQDYVDALMRQCMRKYDCFGYWVDCVFTHDIDKMPEIIEFFSSHGLGVKTKMSKGYFSIKDGQVNLVTDNAQYHIGSTVDYINKLKNGKLGRQDT